MGQKSRAQLEAENRFLKRRGITDAVTAIAQDIIRWAGAFGIAWCGVLVVRTLAGQTTTANIGIKILTDIRVSEAAAWLIAVIFGGYGWRQRTLRQVTVERLEGRVKELEASIDPRRSSSQLTQRGQTNPEDLP